jgi:hypothetical protein
LVTDERPCHSSWRVNGRLADSRGEFGVVELSMISAGWRACVSARTAGCVSAGCCRSECVCRPDGYSKVEHTAVECACEITMPCKTHTHRLPSPCSQPARQPSRQPAVAVGAQLGSSHCVRSVRSCSSSGCRLRRRPSLMLQLQVQARSSRKGFGHVCTYHLD